MLSPGSEPVESSRNPYPAINNRRKRVRQKVHLPAYASVDGISAGMALDLNEIVDISEDGVCIQTSSPLKPESTLTLSLDLMETKAFVSITGKVIWSDQRGRHGIQFPEISEMSRQQLKQWLFANAVAPAVDRPRVVSRANDQSSARGVNALRPHDIREPVWQSPEQRRAAIAAATQEAELPAPVDYSAVLSALVAVKREVEATGTDVDRVQQLLAERALSLTHATGAALAVATEAGFNSMVCIARAGSDAPGLGARLQVGSGFSGECVRTGRVLRCDDAEIDPRVDQEGSRLLGIRSMIAAPIRRDDVVVGLLEVFSPHPNSFGPNDQKILERLVEMMPASIDSGIGPTKTAPVDSAHSVEVVVGESPEILEPQGADAESSIESGQGLESDTSPSRFRRLLLVSLILLAALTLLIVARARNPNFFKNFSHLQSDTRDNPAKTASAPVPGGTDFDTLLKLANDGDPNAQFVLGARYATGEDVKQDYSESVRWFTLAAEQGHVIAQATLGAYYFAGRGIPQDLSQAYFWSLIAAAGGDEASKYRVAALASRMPHSQIAAVQLRANDWLKAHQISGKMPQ
jgi:GAF domain-containing protein